jgi:chemotaxis protein methyltransferase CheR
VGRAQARRAAIRPELAPRGRARIWSAGSSYGAEAYTIAAVCREVAPSLRVEIDGTDLDKRMVARAKEGRFSAEDARTSPPEMMRRHFNPLPDGGWEAKPELKRMLRFQTGDLLRMAVPAGRYDVVFCRNTVIYFTEEVRDALHERLVKSLAPGGYLIVGTSERVADPRGLGLTSPHHFVYRKS